MVDATYNLEGCVLSCVIDNAKRRWLTARELCDETYLFYTECTPDSM
jgi:hypothetical protein